MTVIDKVARDIFEPLCEETKRMLRPIRLLAEDRLTIRLDKTGRHFNIQCWRSASYDKNARLMPSSNAIAFASRVPELTYTNTARTEWSAACTDITALLIHTLWPEDQLIFENEARIMYDSLLLRWVHQTIASRERAAYKLNKIVPALPPHASVNPQYPPNEYQSVALATTIDYDACALFMEQGTGKTPTAIYKIMAEAAKKRQVEGGKSCYTVLVAVPKNIRANWQREVHKFATLPGRVTVLRGGGFDRIKLLCKAIADDPEHDALFSIVISSYETIKNSLDALGIVPWDLVIADESHFIKSPTAKRLKVMLKLRDVSNRRMILTGTPITNSMLDLYGQLEFLGEGFSGFMGWKQFRKFYGRFEKNDYTKHEKLVGYQNIPFIQERLARLAFMISKKDALPHLPQKTYDVVEVPMTKEQHEVYTKLQEQLAVEIEGIDFTESIAVNNVLTMLLRLAQITSGYCALDGKIDPATGATISPKSIKFFMPTPKLEQLVTDLKNEPPTTKTIVWTVFIPTIKSISERLTREGIKHVVYYGGTSDADRAAAEHAFNHDDETRVFVGNPAAGGCGLNLWGYDPDNPKSEMNCDHVIRFSSNWSMVQRCQSEDRCHRIGTRKTVRYTDYIVPNSIDEEILERVSGHIASAETIQDVRAIMRRVLETIPTASSEDFASEGSVDVDSKEDVSNEE